MRNASFRGRFLLVVFADFWAQAEIPVHMLN